MLLLLSWSCVLVLAPAVLGLAPVVSRGVRFFGSRRPVRVWNDESAPIWDGDPLTVVVWNMQFGAGIRQHFFYDGGLAVSTPKDEVLETTTAIGEALAGAEADIVLLQEVDRRSRRTAYVDEFERLSSILEGCGLSCRSSASYWRVPYVPHPKHDHLGRIGMHLATFSRFQIESATRWQLPLLRESRIRRLFNLRRAALDLELRRTPRVEKPLSIVNTHLSAFSRGDGTLERQVGAIREKILDPKGDAPWFLAGDFNCISPYEDPNNLGEEADLYPKDKTDVQPLYDRYNAAFSSPDVLLPTYKPFRAARPDRTIDHAFASSDVVYDNVTMLDTGGRFLSDHQPLRLALRFPGAVASP
ncbi:hypothetical protein CTAYLR_000220 [Chrysophaeum taylorii]|uniref:Endonuclease/exonuclease/phosphatase domain-containing protein n=1 Tax=Chrysophaeum taylorii TaxID=2483200 RepID=A0AAD7UG63_9STRA|nr:hypothetical protein CTAYLR_000220 [Chrysophaeum taylorii]